jgi:antitoxin VapB
MGTTTSEVFEDGNGQAVRIPAEFRLHARSVRISRNADGDLVLRPLHARHGAALMQVLRDLRDADDAFLATLEADRAAPQGDLTAPAR